MGKCLWCGDDCGEDWFHKGGGKTIGISNTGEGTVTKSYCYSDFLELFKLNKTLGLKPTTEETEFLKWKDDIKEWYKQLNYEEYKKV